MTTSDVAVELTREHREIDSDIGAFIDALGNDAIDTAPLATAFEALRRHIYLEEDFLFPPIRAAGMVMPLMVMANEHGTIWHLMDAIEAELEGPDPGRDSLKSGCTELLERLDQRSGRQRQADHRTQRHRTRARPTAVAASEVASPVQRRHRGPAVSHRASAPSGTAARPDDGRPAAIVADWLLGCVR